MPSRSRRLSSAAFALLLLAAAGCASRSPDVASGGTRDERRLEIARLDRQITVAEQELGLRAYATPPPPEVQDGTMGGGTPAGENLDAQPTAPDNPPPMAPAQQSPPPTMTGDQGRSPRVEPGAGGGTCARVCRSVAAICDASSRICRLADDLDDAWASGRCESSTRSCDAAERRAASSCGDC